MRIEQFDPAADPERLRACHRLFTAGGDVERLMTYNSDSNKHMIAINTELGCRPMDRLACWELSVRAAAGQP